MECKKCGADLPENAAFCFLCGKAVNYTPTPRKRPNGSGTVYKHGSGWRAQVTMYMTVDDDGKVKRKRKTKDGFSTKKKALAYLEKLRVSNERKIPTLLELYEEWSENEMQKLSKSKQVCYKNARKRIEPIIARRIDSLTTSDLQNVVNSSAPTFYTARDVKALISHLYNKACANQFVQQNLAAYIIMPEQNSKESEPFTEEEVSKMWVAYSNGNTFLGYLLLMINSGMMPGELLSCKKSMIDYERCEIYGCGKKTKVRKDTPIVFSKAMIPVLKELSTLSDDDRLCKYSRNSFVQRYYKSLEDLGIRQLPPYACRHTTATQTAKLNLNAPTIQKIMRHSIITTSQRYIHLGSDEAHKAAESISQVITAKSKKSTAN